MKDCSFWTFLWFVPTEASSDRFHPAWTHLINVLGFYPCIRTLMGRKIQKRLLLENWESTATVSEFRDVFLMSFFLEFVDGRYRSAAAFLDFSFILSSHTGCPKFSPDGNNFPLIRSLKPWFWKSTGCCCNRGVHRQSFLFKYYKRMN